MIDHKRRDLEALGVEWRETRPCKRCGKIIEIHWAPPDGKLLALEVRPELDFKLRSHVEYCTGQEQQTQKQRGMFS